MQNIRKIESNCHLERFSGIGIVEAKPFNESKHLSLFGSPADLNFPFWNTAVPHYMRKVEACNDPSLEFSEQARYTFNVRERDRHTERERERERERQRFGPY